MSSAGHGVLTPIKQPRDGNVLDADNQTYNTLDHATRAIGGRGFAMLTARWRALQRITASPSKIGHIVAGALVRNEALDVPPRSASGATLSPLMSARHGR